MRIDRRAAIMGMSASALLAAGAAAGAALQPTPAEIEGPFFPLDTNIERDADLTRLAGRSSRAAGKVIEVRGRVLDARGAPVEGAYLELWQANAASRYAHPRDTSTSPLDPNFQGYAILRTGGDGRFSVVSVKPGAYRVGSDLRTPHLHWKIVSGTHRLTTQMYFPNEPLNETDMLIDRMGDPRALIARAGTAKEPNGLAFEWDVVLKA